MSWQCHWSKTLGPLERPHQEIWGTREYENDTDPTVFFGCYGWNDLTALKKHKGEKHILWAGTDIIHLQRGYWLDDKGKHRLPEDTMGAWLNDTATNWCENEPERQALEAVGIKAKVQPSFLGDIDDFPVSFVPGNKVYSSVSGDDFERYGWDKIAGLARVNQNIEIVLYGNTKQPYIDFPPNVTLRGRVPKEVMNEEIAGMQGALRMIEVEGFSEIIAKSVLMGQYPISLIDYPHMLKPDQLQDILMKGVPNIEGREYYRKTLNNFPWSTSFQK